MNKKITQWKSVSLFVDVDTGEIINVTNERQLKYLDYIIINKTKKFRQDDKLGIIEYTNECRKCGQRRINFAEYC